MLIGYVRVTDVRVIDAVTKIAKQYGGGKYVPGAQRTAYSPAGREDFELILTVKMETRHPVGDHLAVSFRHL